MGILSEIKLRDKLQIFFQENKYPILITILFALYSIYLHLYLFSTPMGQTEEIWLRRINWHIEYAAFAHRMFQNYSTLLIHKMFGLPVKESFFVVQYILFLFIGIFFYRYLRLLSFNRLWSNIGLVLLLSAYPILGAHFSPIYTWDDFWSYLFVLLMIIYVIKNNWRFVGLYFLLGLLAREQTIIFFPILLLLIYDKRKDDKNFKRLFYIALSIFIYVLYRLYIWKEINPTTWGLIEFNFENPNRTNDTLMSLFLSFGFIWFIYFTGFIKLVYQKVVKEYRLLLVGSVTTIILTIIIGLFFAFARETRILFPPFVFVIPIALVSLKSITTFTLKSKFKYLKFIFSVILLTFIITNAISYFNSLNIKPDFGAGFDFRILLLRIHIGIVVALIGFYLIHAIVMIFNWGRIWFDTYFKKHSRSLVVVMTIISIISIIFVFQIFKKPESITIISNNNLYNNKIKIVDIEYEIFDNKPQALLFSFVAIDSIQEDYRIFFHVLKEGDDKMINLDFVPYPRVYDWQLNKVILLKREIVLEPGAYICVVGFFNDNGRMGLPYKFKLKNYETK